MAQHAVKDLSSLDNVTVMIIRITVASPHIPLPEEHPLEGWQWSRATVTNSRTGRIDHTANSESQSYTNSNEQPISRHVFAKAAAVNDDDDELVSIDSSRPSAKFSGNSYTTTSSKSYTNTNLPSSSGHKETEDEGDMLDFLMDDSNF